MTEGRSPARPRLSITFVPVAAAIGVFGLLYGAAARPILGAPLAIASSLIVFSGTVQFTMVGLMGAASSSLAVVCAIFVVNLRNLALGTAVRPHLRGSSATRVAPFPGSSSMRRWARPHRSGARRGDTVAVRGARLRRLVRRNADRSPGSAALIVSPTRSIPWILSAGAATYLAITLL